jgi:hypothetical protein
MADLSNQYTTGAGHFRRGKQRRAKLKPAIHARTVAGDSGHLTGKITYKLI